MRWSIGTWALLLIGIALPVGMLAVNRFEFTSRTVRDLAVATGSGTVIAVLALANQRNRRLNRDLRDSEMLYRSLVDTLPVNVLRKDLHGRITFCNQRYCAAMHRPMDELLGKSDLDLFPAALANKYQRDDRRVIETREIFEDIESHQTPDGSLRYVHVLKAPVFDSAGDLVGTQALFWDETARKKAEEDLARTATDLARSNRDLEQFAYVASHDLQEPLRMVGSYTQLLAYRYRDKLDAEANEFIQFAVDGAQRMQTLIRDLLTFSRVGTQGKPPAPTDLNAIFARVQQHLQVAIVEANASVTHDPLPEVLADASQLTLLLQNLLGNALKFRGECPPKIHLKATLKPAAQCPVPTTGNAGEPDPWEWEFQLSDNGIGIEPQYFERIFVIFQRLHTVDQYPGTGIGLALCKRIIERHQGRIWVESTYGKGSTFYFTLPHHSPVTK